MDGRLAADHLAARIEQAQAEVALVREQARQYINAMLFGVFHTGKQMPFDILKRAVQRAVRNQHQARVVRGRHKRPLNLDKIAVHVVPFLKPPSRASINVQVILPRTMPPAASIISYFTRDV